MREFLHVWADAREGAMGPPQPVALQWEVSPLTAVDVRGAAALVRDLRTEMNGKVVCTINEILPVLARALDERSYWGFVAHDASGEVVGYLGLNSRFAIYAGGPFFQITELYVAPHARRHGVARALVGAAEAAALRAGGSGIELGAPSQEGHPGTHAFYGALGYATAGPRLSKALMPSGH